MGKYQILRMDGRWFVMLGNKAVECFDTKGEAEQWVKDNP